MATNHKVPFSMTYEVGLSIEAWVIEALARNESRAEAIAYAARQSGASVAQVEAVLA